VGSIADVTHLLAGVIHRRQISKRRFEATVAQPLLYLPSGRTVLMAIRGKVLAEPMQNPVLAHWGVGTRDGLAVYRASTLPTVQTALECNHFEPANQMTIGLAVLPENQGRPVLACRQLGDQLVGDWDDTLFAIFRFEPEVGLLDDRNCLFLGVDVWVFANADFRLSHPCTEEESPEESVVFGGDPKQVFQFLAGVGFWRLLNILDPDAHIGHWRTRTPSFFISQKRNDVLDAVCTGAVFVSLLEQERVERLQVLLRDLMDEDFRAGLLEHIKRQLVGCVRLGCQLLNVAEVGLDLGVYAVAVRGNGGFRRRALGGKLLLTVSTDLPTVALFQAAAGSVPRDSHASLPLRLVRWW